MTPVKKFRGLTNGKHHLFSHLWGCVCMMLKYDRYLGIKWSGQTNIYFTTWFLSGWWLTYPSEEYESIGIIIPNLWKNKTCSKPPTSISLPVIMLSWGSFPPILTIQCSNSDTSPHDEKWLKRNESSRSPSPVRTYTTGERYFRNTAMATFSTSAGKQLLAQPVSAFSDQWIGILFRIYGHHFKSHDGSMVLVYMLTWLGYIDGIHVTIDSSTMDPMGMGRCWSSKKIGFQHVSSGGMGDQPCHHWISLLDSEGYRVLKHQHCQKGYRISTHRMKQTWFKI